MNDDTRAAELVRDVGGPELLERLRHLDRLRPDDPDLPSAPAAGDRTDFDVVVAGGGLSFLMAPLLAEAGLRVAVANRGEIGVGHREWNASGPELESLVRSGLFSAEQAEALVIARYDHGFCQWHGGRPWPVTGVLDHAVDAGGLLAATRARALRRGVTLLDRHSVVGDSAGPTALRIRLRPGDGGPVRDVTTRLLIDARGAASPAAAGDLVCPTVGGVFEGFAAGQGPRRVDPGVGEILVTTEDLIDGRQHVWEAFPGRPGQTTVYLFHYARRQDVRPGELTRLYARLFDRLPHYKDGDARLLRPTFGFIPGWSRLRRQPPDRPRVIRFGDAAARHSALTYCGFGHMLRSFQPTAERLIAALGSDDPTVLHEAALPDLALHRGTGALSALLSRPPAGHQMNALLDGAFGTLHGMGNDAYAALLQDRMAPETLLEFLRRTAERYPRVYRDVFGSLGAGPTLRWGFDVVRRGAWGARRRRSGTEAAAPSRTEAAQTRREAP